MTPREAIAKIKAGVLQQCEPKEGAFILFPYSATALRITKIGYTGKKEDRKMSFIEAKRRVHLGFESSEKYVAKSPKTGEFFILQGNYIVDENIKI